MDRETFEQEIANCQDVYEIIKIATKYIKCKDDYELASEAYTVLGQSYYMYDETKDVSKAKGYFEEATSLNIDNGLAHYYLGEILYTQGNLNCYWYFSQAVANGITLAAYTLYQQYYVLDHGNMTKAVRGCIYREMKSVVHDCKDLEDNTCYEPGLKKLALALIGLFDLDFSGEIDRKKGMEYFKQAVECKNPFAMALDQNHNLLAPETFLEKPKTKSTKTTTQRKTSAPSKGSSKFKFWIAVIAIILILLFVFRTFIIGLFKYILIFVCICISIYAFFIMDDSEGPLTQMTGGAEGYANKYKEEHDFSKLPSYVFDSSGRGWTLARHWDYGAVYYNNDDGYKEVTVHYCDLKSKRASGDIELHWY